MGNGREKIAHCPLPMYTYSSTGQHWAMGDRRQICVHATTHSPLPIAQKMQAWCYGAIGNGQRFLPPIAHCPICKLSNMHAQLEACACSYAQLACTCSPERMRICTCSTRSVHMLNWSVHMLKCKCAYAQLACTCSPKILCMRMLTWKVCICST